MDAAEVITVNGSFESNFNGWSATGNLFIESTAPYAATDGAKLVSFNGNLNADSPPNAVLSQSFATLPGTTYTLTFDMGVIGVNLAEQRLQVTVDGTGSLLSQIVSKSNVGGLTPQWTPRSYAFVADNTMTTLTFRDISTVTTGIDMLLDNVRITAPSITPQVPQFISYQCRIATDGVNFTGGGQFKFALIDGTGTTTLWSNDGSSSGGGQPINSVPLSVIGGLCSALLGDTSLTNMAAIPVSVFTNSDVRLRVWFNDGSHGWQQLTPDERIAAVGYAMVADTAATVNNGAITTSKFATDAVVGNLNAAGGSGVPSGGLVLSMKDEPSLLAAGYVKIGTTSSSDSLNSYVWKSAGPPAGGTPPATRHGHTAVWTGSELVVWGGNNNGNWFDDGGCYRPAVNNWAATNPSGTPSARVRHATAWTGSEMILWGGQDRNVAGVLPRDLSRYNPVSNTWIPGSSTDAPAGRTYHSVVWTGTEFIVWGGMDSDGTSLNSGGRYNPADNTWRPISSNGAPGARRAHTAVWTGDSGEMIIWGGTAPPNWLNDGARYSPATDSWSALASANAPAARSGHSAIWTGTEMIVWGGEDGGNHFTDLRRYNPSTNSWTVGTNFDAPAGRTYHSAVWTGEEMIVWGGIGENGLLNGGGRFNVTNNRWMPLTPHDAPAARWAHAAVWTGTEMIVWGGEGNTGYLNDTWILTPARTMHVYQKP